MGEIGRDSSARRHRQHVGGAQAALEEQLLHLAHDVLGLLVLPHLGRVGRAEIGPRSGEVCLCSRTSANEEPTMVIGIAMKSTPPTMATHVSTLPKAVPGVRSP